MTLQNKVLAPSLCVTPAAFERPAQAGQIIEISRVGPGTTQRERSGETDCDERDDGWGIIRPGASHELDSFTRAEIIHTNMTMLSWHHRGDSITEPWQCPSCVRLCLLSRSWQPEGKGDTPACTCDTWFLISLFTGDDMRNDELCRIYFSPSFRGLPQKSSLSSF